MSKCNYSIENKLRGDNIETKLSGKSIENKLGMISSFNDRINDRMNHIINNFERYKKKLL